MTPEEWREVAEGLRRAAEIVRPKTGGNVVELPTDDWPHQHTDERRQQMAENYLCAAAYIEQRWPV